MDGHGRPVGIDALPAGADEDTGALPAVDGVAAGVILDTTLGTQGLAGPGFTGVYALINLAEETAEADAAVQGLAAGLLWATFGANLIAGEG